MKHAALLIIALVTASGCKKKNEKVEDKPVVGSGSSMTGSGSSADTGSAGAGSSMAGSGSSMAGAGSGSGSGSAAADTLTQFARFDDPIAGKGPWVTDAEAKAGIVELIAEDDLSGKTKGTFTTKRLCGDAAKKSVETLGAAFAKRAKDASYDPTQCVDHSEVKDRKVCLSMGLGEGDVSYYLEYQKTGETWTLIGAQSVAVGVNTDNQDKVYTKLLGDKCK